jgi:hypothetical protein
MSFTISRLPQILFRSLLAVSLTILLVACGGGGGGGGGGGTNYTTLFEDNFDAPFLSKWTISGPDIAEHDSAFGFPDLGSLKMSGDSRAQASISSFFVGNGMRVYVRVQIPDSTVADTGTQSGLMVEIESAEFGTGSALIRIWRSPCTSGADPTVFEYVISTPGGGGSYQSYEPFSCSSAPGGKFVDFTFIVHPDGSTEWQREGITKASYPAPFGSGAVNLNLYGGSTSLGTIPGFYLWYDDILVVN